MYDEEEKEFEEHGFHIDDGDDSFLDDDMPEGFEKDLEEDDDDPESRFH